MQIAVLGMHRSGTSVVARLLNMMGCYFSPEGVENSYSVDNPKGYWERPDVVELNTATLHEIGCDWDEISALHLQALKADKRKKFNSSARKILVSMDGHRPWFIKDPRLCLLFPLWRELFEVPVCVLVTRNPLEVAHSLKARNRFPLSFGFALWEKYVLLALKHSLQVPRIHISHQQLMQDPVHTVTRLRDQLLVFGVEPLRQPNEREIFNFIDPDLYRQRAEARADTERLSDSQADLLALLESGEALRLTSLPELSVAADAALRKHDLEKALQQMLKSSEAASATEARRQISEKAVALVEKVEMAMSDFGQEIASQAQAFHEKEQSLRGTIGNLCRKINAIEVELKVAQLWKSRNQLFFPARCTRSGPAPSLIETSEGYARFIEWRRTYSVKVRRQAELEQEKACVQRASRRRKNQQIQEDRQQIQQYLKKATALQEAVERRDRQIQRLRQKFTEAESRWKKELAKLDKCSERALQELGRLLNSNRWRLGCWLSLKSAGSQSKEARRFAKLLATRPRPKDAKESPC